MAPATIEERWIAPQTAPARFQAHAWGTVCALERVSDEDVRGEVDRRKLCHVCWEMHKKRYKTAWLCACFRNGVCGPTSGRECFDLHVRNRRRAGLPVHSGENGEADLQERPRAQ